MKRVLILMMILLLNNLCLAQGLFDEALERDISESESMASLSYELNGYVRADVFVGENTENDDHENKSLYGEAALKLKVKKGEIGDGYLELRFKDDQVNQEEGVETELRESYIALHPGPVDLTFGRQIVVWGKADGFNPTNNITPLNYQLFSPHEDDRRGSNTLLRTFLNGEVVRLEAIWVPKYKASVLPITEDKLPAGVTLEDPDNSDNRIHRGATALKIHWQLSAFEASLSWFQGLHPLPGIVATFNPDSSISVTTEPYRTRIVGVDFSTTIGNFGLRGEVAHSFPLEEQDATSETWQSIPREQVEGVLGVDREFGDFSLIIQYIVKTVSDFEELEQPNAGAAAMSQYTVALWNRMLFGQLKERTEAVSIRPAWSLLHETLEINILGYHNRTTKESFLIPKLSYSLADDLTFTFGAQLYDGPEDTLYGTIKKGRNSVFSEFKASF